MQSLNDYSFALGEKSIQQCTITYNDRENNF